VELKDEISELARFLDSVDIKTSQAQEKQIFMYVKLLRGWNQKINLFSRAGSAELVRNHLVSSFLYVQAIRGFLKDSPSQIIDLGSGGGFPGIVLSMMLEEAALTLVDATRKKTIFLKRVVRDLGLSVRIQNLRVEELRLPAADLFPFGVARAFANIRDLITYAKPIMRKGGVFFSLKGEDFEQELDPEIQKTCGIDVINIEEEWIQFAPRLAHKTMIKLEF